MKTFKIIGLIALLIVLFEFIGGFNDGWSDVDKLAPISIESADPAFDKVTATTFDVLPDSAIQAANSQAGTTVPTGFMQCHSYIVPSGLTNFTYILLGLTGLVSFYGLYNLIRLFISIIRKEVFTSINIRRIRWGVYPPIAITWLSISSTGVKPVMPWHNLQFRDTPSSPHLLLSSVG
ncbi:hypothetical protein [Phocaeicola plebeius]|uniref:hypothetical protein n=1 Tax=Phocaeicola plebeius TaxID=310297 RepID=UPI003A92BB09